MSAPQIEFNSTAEGASLTNWERASSDVENSVAQESIADSILGDNVIGDHRNPNWFESVEDSFENDEPLDYETSAEQERPDLDELAQRLAAEHQHNETLNMAEASLHSQDNQPQAPATAQQVYAGIEQLDHATEASGLKSPEQWQPMVGALTASFGADPASCDGQRLGSALGKCLQSAADIFIARNGDIAISARFILSAPGSSPQTFLARSAWMQAGLTSRDFLRLCSGRR